MNEKGRREREKGKKTSTVGRAGIYVLLILLLSLFNSFKPPTGRCIFYSSFNLHFHHFPFLSFFLSLVFLLSLSLLPFPYLFSFFGGRGDPETRRRGGGSLC